MLAERRLGGDKESGNAKEIFESATLPQAGIHSTSYNTGQYINNILISFAIDLFRPYVYASVAHS